MEAGVEEERRNLIAAQANNVKRAIASANELQAASLRRCRRGALLLTLLLLLGAWRMFQSPVETLVAPAGAHRLLPSLDTESGHGTASPSGSGKAESGGVGDR